MSNTTQLTELFTAIDSVNQQDPNLVSTNQGSVAKEYLYAQRMTEQLSLFAPTASEHLQIACRAQHIKRWAISRSDYPMDRTGYRKWRIDLGTFHAELTAQLMADKGYSETDQVRVKSLLQKKQLKRDTETQTLEDVACLVFLNHYLTDFAAKHEEEKLISIIQKTWHKMSEAGHQAALKLPLPEALLSLIQKALS
jgi:hypothetical protein